MNRIEFVKELQKALEFEDLEFTEQTNLKGIARYDSMSVVSIIAFVDEHLGKKLTAQQLASITTVGSLLELVGL